MYTSFFGLNEKPFSITPDPRYLFLSERHGEALAHLVYGRYFDRLTFALPKRRVRFRTRAAP